MEGCEGGNEGSSGFNVFVCCLGGGPYLVDFLNDGFCERPEMFRIVDDFNVVFVRA